MNLVYEKTNIFYDFELLFKILINNKIKTSKNIVDLTEGHRLLIISLIFASGKYSKAIFERNGEII